jgi:hypothetical protein
MLTQPCARVLEEFACVYTRGRARTTTYTHHTHTRTHTPHSHTTIACMSDAGSSTAPTTITETTECRLQQQKGGEEGACGWG